MRVGVPVVGLGLGECSLSFRGAWRQLGQFENLHSDSVGLKWGLRSTLSCKLLRSMEVMGPLIYFEQKRPVGEPLKYLTALTMPFFLPGQILP